MINNLPGNHPYGSAYVDNLQLHDYRWGEVFVLDAFQPYAQIQSHGTTTSSVDYDLIYPFDIQQSCTYSTNKVARREVTVDNQSTLTVGDGVRLDMYGTEAHDCKLLVESGSSLVIGDNAVITAKRGDCEIVVNGNIQIGHNVTFKAEVGATLSIRINGQREISVTDCLFANASLQIGMENRVGRPMPSSATVSNCRFEAKHGLCQHALRISGYSYITLADNTVDGRGRLGSRHYTEGILIYNSGLAGLGSLVLRNTIKGCTGTGLTLYGSAGNIKRNEVTLCGEGVRLLNGSTINEFTGNCAASNPSQTQHIHDNDECEVYVYRDCLPQTFRYNRITGSGSSWLVEYENNVDDGNGLCIRIDLEHNNWGNLTNTQIENLFHYVTNTNNEAVFDYLPKWTMGDCLVSGEEEWDRLTREADSLLGIGLYSSAKAGYKEIVSLYPNTSGATNAMKKLMMAESLSEENYGDIQQYYLNDTTIQNSPTLAALAGSLANKCDELLENYDEAIAWYEAVIQDEDTPYNDSLFATIDLGNLYLKMEANGAKGARGTLAQFVPKSAEAFAEQTDEALRKLKTHPSRLNPSRELPDQYWVDIVTEQPEGYVVDANGDVHLYSAEALAWLSVVSNGLNGQEADNFDGKKVTLEANVDMSAALWTPITTNTNMPAFSGAFDGKEHVVDGLVLKAPNAYSNRIGFFGNTAEATLSNIVLRNGYLEGSGYGMGFFVSKATKSTIDHCFVECEMHGVEGVPFVYSIDGSDISNCMVYSPMLQKGGNYDIGGAFAAENRIHNGDGTLPTIQNCAAIIEKMDFSFGETWGFVGQYNHGLIENCYVYIEELSNFPGYSGNGGPRNGITKDNMGEIRNCYYNRIRNHDTITFSTYYLGLDDQPAVGTDGIINTHPFTEEGRGQWKLTQPVSFELESGTVSTDDLLEALNLKVQQMEGDNFLSWCDTNPVFNSHDLPVFCNLDITETAENTAIDNQATLHPNPTNGEVTVSCEGLSRIRIVNAFGQTVYNATHQGDQARIDLSHIAKGIYMMHIEANGGQTVRKIVVE
ncbi:MAG: T9SS type A sorting domain-containing protein [Bacteroidales bacterium]|nr:T9SS type A sorting domain-containing protein [Bacteroidales bacterium]